jgi:predicted alpha/beta hydrolase family esterase
MPRRSTRSVPTVILHGWQGSPPPHWQAWLADQLREAGRDVRFPELPEPDRPTRTDWLAALRDTLRGLPETGFDVVAHSLGSLLWLHHASASPAAGSPRPARVALVAPVSPHTAIEELASFQPVPIDIDAVRRAAEGTVLVAGDADPYTPEGIGEAYARPLKVAATVLPGAGHINVVSGFGPWPQMLAWCERDSLAFF